MLTNKPSINSFLLTTALIILVSLIFLYPSFFLAFSVDEFDNLVDRNYYHLAGVFNPYGVPLLFFSTLYNLLGSNPLPFFVIAFFLRIINSLTILFLTYKLTKNRLAAFFSGLFFAISFTGIQTTSEPVNMTVYLTLTCSIIFIFFFFSSRKELQKKYLFLMGFFLLVATIISPIRINPIYPWALLVDFFWLTIYRSKNNLKKFIVRQFIIFSILFFLITMGSFSYGTPSGNAFLGSASVSVNKIAISLSRGNFSIISNILTGFGNVMFPNEYNYVAKNFNPGFNLFLGFVFIFILLIAFISIIKKPSEKKLLFFSFLIWIPIFYISSWIVSFSASNELVINSFRRYLLPAFVGVVVSFGYLSAWAIKNKNKVFLYAWVFLISFLILFHAFSVLNFLSSLKSYADGPYVEKIWQQIKIAVPNLPEISENKISIFYFELDGAARAKYATDNAFSQRAAVLYNIPQDPNKLNPNPHSTYSFEELTSYVRDGNPLKMMGYIGLQSEPVTWDRIFAFRVEGDYIIDIKADVKKRVEEALKK